jgi:hypothetical protein
VQYTTVHHALAVEISHEHKSYLNRHFEEKMRTRKFDPIVVLFDSVASSEMQ